jgi:hypothetical protein
MAMDHFETVFYAYCWYGDLCSTCKHLPDGYCEQGYRTKTAVILTGHVPDVVVRKKGGCEDHEWKDGCLMWDEEPPVPRGDDYGGVSTSLL